MFGSAKGKGFPLYPFFPLIGFAFVSAVGFSVASSVWVFAFLGALYLLGLVYGNIRGAAMAIFSTAFMALFFVGIPYAMAPDPKALQINAAKCLSLTVPAMALLSLSPDRLCQALDTVRAPRIMSLTIRVVFGFLPLLFKEKARIRTAMRIRGGRIHGPFAFFHRMIVPFLVRVFSISDVLSLSLETRGFDLKSKPKEIYEPVFPKWQDWVWLILTVGIGASMLGVGLWLR